MRKLILLLSLICGTSSSVICQYWQQEVKYRIDVSLNDKQHALDGMAKIDYINHSPDTLTFIWFHLWPNAYKNDQTAFSDQLLENGNTRFYFSSPEEKGYINRLDFKVNGSTARVEDHPEHIDIVKLILSEPLLPGKQITITTPFHVRLPYNFSRGGHDGESYQATQWYPKPAVYDRDGWHPMPYLHQGEFFSEFGSFEVNITVPKNYVVAATGELQNEDEKQWLKSRSGYDWQPSSIKSKSTTPGSKSKEIFPASDAEFKTLKYLQSNIHDFAWFADKRFTVNHDTCILASGKLIDIFSYYSSKHKEEWSKSVQYAKDGIRFYSEKIGEYPYRVASVVQGPQSFGGGMEYPTITVISPVDDDKTLDFLIAHELGHNWFYGILASNEHDRPWMDEGMNSYYDHEYRVMKYGKPDQLERILFETKAFNKTDQAITTTSADFSEVNYGLSAYYKTAEWLRYLESLVGKDAFNAAMQEYYRRWQFKHPKPEDFKTVFEQSTSKDLDEAFAYLDKKGLLPNHQRKGTKTAFILSGKQMGSYLKNPSKNLILFGPALGVNSYDKLLAGAFITNMKLPPSQFQFLLAPMYGVKSENFGGLGIVKYSFVPDGFVRKIDIGVNASSFSMDEFQPDSGNKIFFSFQKIVPTVRFTFRENNPRSHVHRYIQFKTFLISEERLKFSRDSIFTPTDTIVVDKFGSQTDNRTLNQVKFVLENNRALYPYNGELKIEQAEDFVRAAFTGNYFFNYPKEGGLNLRLFAGKFFYTGSKTIAKQFATDRYHLNMTGANGYEDYTYSDYFIGRNRFEGAASQQIMMRDGGFKVRTDLLSDKVGRSDDWLAAINLSSTVPSGLNPLSMLPVKIPLKVFLDIGTYSDAWKQDAQGDRFLFDAGLELSFLKETVRVFLPLIYSRVYKDYIQSTLEKKGRLWKTISFTIDISNFSLRKMHRNLDF